MAGEIQRRFQQILKNSQPNELAKVAYAEWKAKTPVASGNAKRSTSLKNDEIHANYPYATRLDNGWSKQFGGIGMSKPAIQAVQKYIANKLNKKGA